MGEGNAWVTLATNDSYSLGALVLAHSLRRVATKHQLAILVTPGVTPIMRERLSSVFSKVITVDVLDSGDAAHLALLARPELGITFTKLHCWTLTDYSKCVFLDADTLILQNCDELFDRDELSAAPDVGWPDCFNSGVFVYRPSNETFQSLLKLAKEKGSFDGGDQGLLNQYFSDWARGDISKHLPFLYNVCSTAFYSYLPALKQYGSGMKIIHFIGNVKPWLQSFNWASRSVSETGHLQAPLQYWWDIFLENVHPSLDAAMAGVAGALSQLTIGASQQSAAVEEHLRRQGWEAGNIDYMGADAFDNIWAKISQTLSGPTEAAAPPPQPEPAPAPAPAPAVIETPATPIPVEPVIAPVLSSCPVESAPPPAEPIQTPAPAPVEIAPVEAAPIEAVPVEAAPVEVAVCPCPCPLVKEVPSEASSAASGDSWEKVAGKPAAPESLSSDLSLSGTTVSSVTSSVPSDPEPEPQAASEEKGEGEVPAEPVDVPVCALPAPVQLQKPNKEKLVCHLKPTSEAEQLPTPDTENEDAATIAQSIIAREEALSSPTVTSATPPVSDPVVPLCSPVLQNIKDLSVDTSIPDTPPVPGLVSLAQIGILPPVASPPQPAEVCPPVTQPAEVKTPIEEAPAPVCKKPAVSTKLPEPEPVSAPTKPAERVLKKKVTEEKASESKAPESCEKPKRTPSVKKVASPKVVIPAKETEPSKEPATPTTPATPTPATPTTPAAPTTPAEKDPAAEPAPAPKVKKMVKKVVPKVKPEETAEAASSEVETPVPPPRKKVEKKPKETK